MGIFSLKKTATFFKKHIPHGSFEQLNIPVTICTTNISRGVPEFFSSGELTQVILASATVPLFLKPIIIDGNKKIGDDAVVAAMDKTLTPDENRAALDSGAITRSEYKQNQILATTTYPTELDYDFYGPAKDFVNGYNSGAITGAQAVAGLKPLLKNLPETVGRQLYDDASKPSVAFSFK